MQTVVLLHAFGSSSRGWAPQVAGLRDRYRVLAPNLPDHGDAPGPFTIHRAVETVRSVVAESDGEAHLVGISGGASVALLTCLEHPERAASLMLSAGVARVPRLMSLQPAIQSAIPEPVLTRVLRRWYSGGRRDYEPVATEDFRRCGKGTFLSALREVGRLDLRGRLGEVTAPTLVACGARDRANIARSREIAAGIPPRSCASSRMLSTSGTCNSPSSSTRPLPSSSLALRIRSAARGHVDEDACAGPCASWSAVSKLRFGSTLSSWSWSPRSCERAIYGSVARRPDAGVA